VQTPRARQYLAFSACLLTDAQGIAGPQAAPVWAGMRDASAATGARVEYFAVAGTQTTDNALPYLNGMLRRHCDVVLAVGSAPAAAVSASVSGWPGVRFVVVSGANVVRIGASAPDAVRSAVRDAVASAVRG
jgi:hypothetical protein